MQDLVVMEEQVQFLPFPVFQSNMLAVVVVVHQMTLKVTVDLVLEEVEMELVLTALGSAVGVIPVLVG